MPRALTPLLAAAAWMSDHHGPVPSPSAAARGGRLDGRRGIRRRLLGLGDEAADVGAHAGQRRAPLVEARADGGELGLAGRRRASLAVRSSATSLTARSLSSRLVDSMVRTMSRSQRAMRAHHGQLRDQVAQVGGAEHRVHGGHVVVLVHGDGPRGERGAGQAELLVREALEPAVLLELLAHGLERASGARVPGDGRADLCVEARRSPRRWPWPCRGSAAAPRSAPRPERPSAPRRPRARRARSSATSARRPYGMAVFQCASSRGTRLAPPAWGPPRPGSGPDGRAGVET